ncbi:MAG: carbamoyltransferase C-terminal domain-containing protein [Xanthomonadales bacterium]|nr:carbamoyltransferase C-terminal domain-containing protein [Xanthomonadales bacterium]
MDHRPVLGINGCQDTFHDASASLVLNDAVAASIEEERFNGIKHSKGIPHRATKRVLSDFGIEPGDLGGVGFYLDPWLLMRHYYLHPVRKFYPDSLGLFQAMPFYLNFLRSPTLIRAALQLPKHVPIFSVRHHLCHAAAAYFGSQFEDAAILVVDGSGERETSSYYFGEGCSLKEIGSPMNYPTSIGFFYEGIASHLGLGWIGGAGKMMGLAPFGKPVHYKKLRAWFDFKNDGAVVIDLRKMQYYLNKPFFTEAGLLDIGPARGPEEAITEQHANLAASAQVLLEEAVTHMAICLRIRTGKVNLCYAGGVALNIDANSAILEKAGFKNIYIMPASYDGGTSIGAAIATHFAINKGAKRIAPLIRADLGTIYRDEDIAKALTDAGVSFRRMDETELIQHVASRLSKGAVVGWYRGRMECGPRALGFRSILANPEHKAMADYLNTQVKGREVFRPYAPAVPLEFADIYFNASAASPFMLYKFKVREEFRDKLAAVTHVDGSARAQTVTKVENEAFHALLLKFGEINGTPVLLNTSFNLGGETLVETPSHAIASFLAGKMDVLVVGNFVVDEGKAPGFESFTGLPPMSPGVIAPAQAVGNYKKQEPDRFDIPESRLEKWVRLSVDKYGAEGFFSKFYSRPILALLSLVLCIANYLDRRVIRSI